mmetsp:Transcript_14557/g.49696  ORF Transcript_14557/g.49696 Transcript_14557/m.49696 type:complete len:103 (+) Transcript_14557:866-1174(+)
MTGIRCLLPSFSVDPRPGVNHKDPNAVTLMQEFAEVDFPKCGFSLAKWQQNILQGRAEPSLKQEVAQLFGGGNEELLAILQDMLMRGPGQRPTPEQALSRLR